MNDEMILKQQLRQFDNGSRSLSIVKSLRRAGLIEKNTSNGGWKLTDKGKSAMAKLA